MNRRTRTALLFAILGISPLAALQFTADVTCPRSLVSFSKTGNFDRLAIRGYEPAAPPGEPEIPVMPLKIALPGYARIEAVDLEIVTQTDLPGTFNIGWAKPPVILSRFKEGADDFPAAASIYTSALPYPASNLAVRGTGRLDGYTIVELVFCPFRYYPLSRRLLLLEKVRVSLKYEVAGTPGHARAALRLLVINPDDLRGPGFLNLDEHGEYLIITNPPFDTVFQRLADWKTGKGVPARVRTKDWIAANYPGRDDPEKIRNYAKAAVDSGLKFLLLGGDTDIIPCRFAYAMVCSAGGHPREDLLPCDLYYGDLQGTWNLDNDTIWGETGDSVDLYPDIYVGRAPVNTIPEAQTFVSKVITYERNPPPLYTTSALFDAAILWRNPYTDQGKHKDRVETDYLPNQFVLAKLYERLGNATHDNFMAALRQGQNLINHDGHGWIGGIGLGNGAIDCADFDSLTNNGAANGVMYSIGCWTSAFDFASLAESFVNNPKGGGIAYIGNSSYGWGSPGNPGFGYSDRFDSRFYHELFIDSVYPIGEALALAKAHYIPFSREENVYRWHQYQLNLIGDPELPLWTARPRTMTVHCATTIPVGRGSIMISVTDNGQPLGNARACAWTATGMYARGMTDRTGQATLLTSTQSGDTVSLTVTAHNYLPVELRIPVVSGPYLTFTGWQIDDRLGNNDGIANPNERLDLSANLANFGTAPSVSIDLKLRSTNPLVMIEDSTASFPMLDPGAQVEIPGAFRIRTGTAQNGQAVSFDLLVSDTSRLTLFKPAITIGTPVLHLVTFANHRPPAMPGDTESLTLSIENTGLGYGHGVRAIVSSGDPYLTVLADSVDLGDISPESTSISPAAVLAAIDPTAHPAHLAQLLVTMRSECYEYQDTLRLLIGPTGFADDVESGNSGWRTGGANNLWHITSRRWHSLDHAWYSGDENSGRYLEGSNSWIESKPFMIDERSTLKFWRWFYVPIYGVDGIYVIVARENGAADTLDFIGAGGALGRGGLRRTGITSTWFEESYDLTRYRPGDTIRLRLSFVSDADGKIGEGFYIDDITIGPRTEVDTRLVFTPYRSVFLSAAPSLFRQHTLLRFYLPEPKWVDLILYNVAGQRVQTLVSGPMSAGDYALPWDGQDARGAAVSSGIYFAQLRVEGRTPLTRKVIRVK